MSCPSLDYQRYSVVISGDVLFMDPFVYHDWSL